MKEVDNRQQEEVKGESLALASLVRIWTKRIIWDTGSSSGGFICARERVRWVMVLADQGRVNYQPCITGSELRGWGLWFCDGLYGGKQNGYHSWVTRRHTDC